MARPVRSGRASLRASLSVAAAVGPGPDQAEGLGVLVVEEVGVDRSGEAWIVQLEAGIVAALAGALGPGCADLDPAGEDAVAGGIVSGPVGLGHDADVLGLEREGDDFARELVAAGLLELCPRARTIAASMAIEGPEAIDAASLATAASAEDGADASFLVREEWA